MLAISAANTLVVFDPKKSSICPPPSSTLVSPTAATWAPDNSALFVSHSAGIQKFDSLGKFQCNIYEPSQPPTTLLSKDKGNTLIFNSGNETIVLETGTGKVAHKFDTHKSAVTSLSLSNDATLLVSTSTDAVHVHNLSLNSHMVLRGLPTNAGRVTTCAFHPHARTRLLLGMGSALVIYDTTRPSGPARTVAIDKDKAGGVVAIASSPFSRTLVAVACSGGTIGLIDLEKDKGLFRTLSFHVPLTSLLFSPEGASLYVGTETGKLLVLDLRALDKVPKTIIVSEESQRIVCMCAQRKLKPGEAKTTPAAATKPLAHQDVNKTGIRRAASNTTTTDKKTVATKTKPASVLSPTRIRTTSTTTTPIRLRVTSTATVTQPTPSPRPPIRSRTISTTNTSSARVASGPARPATVAGRAPGISPNVGRRVSGPLTDKKDAMPTKSPLSKSVSSEKTNPLDVSVSAENLLALPKTRKENLSPQGVRQRTVSSLSATSSRTTRTRTISTTSQRSTTSSRAMTGSTVGTSVSGASSASRTTTVRTAKPSTTAAKAPLNTRKGSKEWAADSMSPIPPVPPLPMAFGEAEQLTAVKCPVSRDRTPSPDLPSTDNTPITPLPPSRAAKGKAPARSMGVLGLGTPEMQRWFEAGDNDKREGRKVGFVEDINDDADRGRAKSPGPDDTGDEEDEPQEAKIEMTVQISPRRPPAATTTWAPVPSPLRSSLGGNSGSVPGPSNPAQDLLSTLIRDALYDFRRETKAEIVGLHLDLVNMGRGWRKEMKEAMDQWGTELQEVREENRKLKEENERLRRGY